MRLTYCLVMLGIIVLVGVGLEIDYRRGRIVLALKKTVQRRWLRFGGRRRCTVSRQDARWLAHALDDTDCPACDQPLARHR